MPGSRIALRSFDNRLVIGTFTYLDDFLKAIDMVKERGLDYKVYTPCPIPEVEKTSANFWSKVRIFTFTGATLGLISGFALAILTSLDWPLRTSAKEIVSIPGFVVVGYELTILLGGLFTLFGLFCLTCIPALMSPLGYKPEFSADKFGLVFKCTDEEARFFIEELRKCHADEVEVRDHF
ncbi:MAG: DUF3341 domain-containing protein [Deltaproteobacteria bacterium]|nr:DUF3341 domain-containing protein [Deltaproteobacteria bacterium]MCX7953332.1 DUF3341 domain-containing protein [Deltaproteobacteria bacterium]